MLGARLLPPEVWDDLLMVVKAFLKLLKSWPSPLRVKDLCLEVKPQKLKNQFSFKINGLIWLVS